MKQLGIIQRSKSQTCYILQATSAIVDERCLEVRKFGLDAPQLQQIVKCVQMCSYQVLINKADSDVTKRLATI